ncbi:PrgI family protein [Coprobacillus sp. AF09-1A]|nr:PrgI family protein [Coprobacillus sp. AF09-1A]
MEVKVNKEIRNYTESIYFGLSLRQFIFSILACLMAIGLYFIMKPYFGLETLSWLCILGASPFAALGFITYNGLTAEQFVWAWIKSELLIPKEIKFESNNIYWEALAPYMNNKEREELKRDKNIKSIIKTGKRKV